jgi:hypothetical protein
MSRDTSQAVLTRSALLPSSTPSISVSQAFFASFCRSTTWTSASFLVQTEGEDLVRLTEALPHELLSRRVLTAPSWGIGNESRYWSAEMVLEHLIEVGFAYAEIIVHPV